MYLVQHLPVVAKHLGPGVFLMPVVEGVLIDVAERYDILGGATVRVARSLSAGADLGNVHFVIPVPRAEQIGAGQNRSANGQRGIPDELTTRVPGEGNLL